MTQELFEMTQNLFKKIDQTEECHRRIDDYAHAYQFEVDGQPEFHIKLDYGKMQVVKGVCEDDHTKVSLVKTDSATLKGILKGKIRPLNASKEGKWVIRARRYSGELLYTLLRIGREITIEELLAAQE